jgi:hypothetical protein
LDGIYIEPFPGTGARYQIGSFRGIYPLWSRDGRELFYTPPGQLVPVDVRTEPSFVAGRPMSLPRGVFWSTAQARREATTSRLTDDSSV